MLPRYSVGVGGYPHSLSTGGPNEDGSLQYSGLFRGVCISLISKSLRFAELIFVKLIENHTHVPSVVTLRVQSSQKFSFR